MENLGEFIVNHWMLSSAFVVLAFLVLSEQLNHKLSGISPVDSSTAIRMINQEKGIFLDVREPSEFSKESIADSLNIPLANMADDSSLNDLAQTIVIICASGQRARNAAKILNGKGFTDVHVLTGGLNTWKEAKLPLFSS